MAFQRTPKQTEATIIQAKYDESCLFGGSRSGKTFITVRNIILRAMKVKSRHLIGRLHFNHVKISIGKDTLPKVMSICFPSTEYNIDKTDWYLELPNGSQVWLVGTDDAERVEKILGTEYSSLYFNEASQFANYDTIAILMTRLAENSGLPLRAYFDCNPPTRKHWIHKKFIQGVDPTSGKPIEDWEQTHKSLLMNPKDNINNLPPQYIKTLERLPKKQRERFLEGMFGNDTEGALWTEAMILAAKSLKIHGELLRTVVAVDPAVTNNPDSDEWGITVCQLFEGRFGRVAADYSEKNTTDASAQAVINAYKLHEADAVVVEVNQGGDLVENVLRLKGFEGKVIAVRAAKGKFARAEPVAALYEQGKIAHAAELDGVETEMTDWVPHETKESPNKIDSVVWGFFELFGLSEPVKQYVYDRDFTQRNIVDYDLQPVNTEAVVLGWSFGQQPAVVVLQQFKQQQVRVLEAIQATTPGLRRFVKQIVAPLLARKYKRCGYLSVGSRRGVEKGRSSNNERAAFDILHELGINTVPALDEAEDLLIEISRKYMNMTFQKRPMLIVGKGTKSFTDMAFNEYHYNDQIVPQSHPIAEAFQLAMLEIERGGHNKELPVIGSHVVIDKAIGY